VIIRRFAALLLFCLAALARVGAQTPAPSTPSAPPSDVTVTLVTFGLGQEVFERFGHNALWFHDASTGEDVAYHWGLFSFGEPGFLVRFLTGDTNYWMGAVDARALIDSERRAGRPTTLQRLNLTPAQATALRDFVRWNARDENRFYRYDYFRDNCSTRLRDAIDRAVGGALKRATDSLPTSLTYRRESVRLTEGDAPVQAGIDIALGRPADVPLTAWQSFFIPMRLRDAVRTVRIPGPGGVEVPLVANERVVALPPNAKPIAEAPFAPRLAIRYGLLGVAFAALVVILRVMMLSRRGAAWGLALFGSAWSLLCGVLGVLLLLAWLATRHVFWAHNETVLLLTPLSLMLVVLIPASILSRRGERAARMVAAIVAAFGLVALVLALIPGGQESRAVVALLLPVHVALAWALALPRSPHAASRASFA
jgi:hypothetical protein